MLNSLTYVKRLFLGSALAFLILCSGCSVYTFNPRGKSDIQSIGIERFENQTPEYGLEDRMTDQIIDAFIADGTIKVVPIDNAEATLVGALVVYERKPYRYDENDQVQTYAVNMSFDLTLRKSVDQSEIWKDRIVKSGYYNVADEVETDAQQEAIDLLVEDIINRTTKSW